jgi:hydroxymethylpyrimidine pyrophosphatase-like HAD family hydrolase
MGNAAPEIKQVGKFITKPNTENGVGYGMVTYLNQN